MSVDDRKEQSQKGSGAEGGEGSQGTRPSSPYQEEESKRIGHIEDTRGAGEEEEGESTPEPRDNARDGT
jgi:hypothetical protein